MRLPMKPGQTPETTGIFAIFGAMAAAGGLIFVDRFNHDQAVKALEPAVDALRRGLSIVIAPRTAAAPLTLKGDRISVEVDPATAAFAAAVASFHLPATQYARETTDWASAAVA
mgnify:CR=1 FL=1